MGVHAALSTLLGELADGSSETSGWFLNPKDPGILRSVSALSAADASQIPPGGRSSIAAHVDHIRYSLSLFNRWSEGKSPFGDADWTASWTRPSVSDSEWAVLQKDFQNELRTSQAAVRRPRALSEDDLTGCLASVVHLAYHLGAIRQINAAVRGPGANPQASRSKKS